MLTSTERINAIADYNADGRPREYLIMDDIYYVPTNALVIGDPLCPSCNQPISHMIFTGVIQLRTDHGRTTMLYHKNCFYHVFDISAELDGYFGDTGASMVIAKHVPEYEKMIEATKSALAKALHAARAGQPINLIGIDIGRPT